MYPDSKPPDPSRTQHASQVVHIAELINVRFRDARYGTRRPRLLRVAENDGPSTDGGRKARQSVLLIEEGAESSVGALVCGWLDAPRKLGEVKPYVIVKDQYQQRGSAALDLSQNEYDRAIAEFQGFMRNHGIDIRLVTPTAAVRRASAPPGPAPTEGSGILWAVGGIAFVAGFAACFLLMRAGLLGL